MSAVLDSLAVAGGVAGGSSSPTTTSVAHVVALTGSLGGPQGPVISGVVTKLVEQDRWVLIVDEVILVSHLPL